VKLKERLLAFFDPSRSISWFIIGTATLSLGLQALYDFANEPQKFQGGYVLAIVAGIVAVALLVVSATRRKVIGWVGIKEEHKPDKCAGLILLLGPSEAAAPVALDYHLPVLRHCWMIATTASLKTAATLAERYRTRGIQVYWGEPNYVVDPDQLQSTYDLIIRIVEMEAMQAGLQPHEIIADITGGMKPMTAGMALACLARHRNMQYIKAPRDEAGQPLEGAPAEPIRIDTAFVPAGGFPTG